MSSPTEDLDLAPTQGNSRASIDFSAAGPGPKAGGHLCPFPAQGLPKNCMAYYHCQLETWVLW